MVAFTLAFALVWCVVLGMAARSNKVLSATGYRAVLVVLASLPFLTARAGYFLLGEDGPRRYGGAAGTEVSLDVMHLLVETIAALMLVVARIVAEPLWAALPETSLF
ncbi:hypothetical protein BJX64DRAFT_140785 [Aspergillus heterothallicus]